MSGRVSNGSAVVWCVLLLQDGLFYFQFVDMGLVFTPPRNDSIGDVGID